MSDDDTTTPQADSHRLRRLAILALLASAGERGLNLPGMIAGIRLLTPETIASALDKLQRQGLVRRGTRRHADGDRDVVYYRVSEDFELAVNV
jgi:DNA-binding MarR family transcriptional regulator